MLKSNANKIADPDTVAGYLVEEYEVDDATAKSIVARHAVQVEVDKQMSSFAYWTGDKIADAERLVPREKPDTMDEDEH